MFYLLFFSIGNPLRSANFLLNIVYFLVYFPKVCVEYNINWIVENERERERLIFNFVYFQSYSNFK